MFTFVPNRRPPPPLAPSNTRFPEIQTHFVLMKIKKILKKKHKTFKVVPPLPPTAANYVLISRSLFVYMVGDYPPRLLSLR